MKNNNWINARLVPTKEEEIWEYLHENSKTSRYSPFLSNEEVYQKMVNLHKALPYSSLDITTLPPPDSLNEHKLGETLVGRESSLKMEPTEMSLKDLSTLLMMAYGETRDLTSQGYARPFRTVPSGGGLYPLEIYFYNRGYVEGLEKAIYHYDPGMHNLRTVFRGDFDDQIKNALVQKELVDSASGVFFLTALFYRTTFKYGDRGYRFVMMEAGHVAQNLNLVSTALNYGSLNVGGFFDREIDDMLEIDGIEHSTVYLNMIGKKKGR